MSKESSSSSGVGVAGLLGVAFVVLKLCNVITWSWWWVTAPFWGGIVIVAAALVVYLIFKVFASVVESKKKKERDANWLNKERETPPQVKPSKFMSKLDEAMRASDARKNHDFN